MKCKYAENKLQTKAISTSLTATSFAADANRQFFMSSTQNHLQQFKPLIISAHAPNVEGKLSLFSLHEHTVNLINHQQQLVTLHQYGSGLSPMGWVVKTDDFNVIQTMLANDHLTLRQQSNGDLLLGDILLSYNTHICNMTLKSRTHTELDKTAIRQLFMLINYPTGLFGLLRENIVNNPAPELISLCNRLNSLMLGERVNITQFIGLGPGLTPSFDDIIVGIIAILFCDHRFKPKIQRIKTTLQNLPLEVLTTTISATFLKYALQGKFSLPVLNVIERLNQHRYNHCAIHNLLNYGHTSGADLLLGIWLGIDRFVIKD
ncbi:DUF2877 domain-containing protein [Gilliamella sp. B2776]|uniref:DUF2877 domain-containing protein n=1 Tax=unclassified Gilliamella TaxID=2685620 RepID=UPI002269FB53|nr:MULTISPECIES: DUF2877 domain-containing protein [unclassified Gilliamella]MCX8650507.1 DUF2877 domain-containing protein [Gilliamella sp. B2779]MCX8653962.1 DUF2877 domain-containing protein [Gilliamella sp. B2737]MCX8692355.1 DUF2877 domain-containing protein [Gilliamella sp. B2776]MCX8703443.1 DUF2877 domain-containing protein [Gilliamella sp. B2781]WDM18879.1 DUF2877 domain-containing protein [Gilliamella sp. B3022]